MKVKVTFKSLRNLTGKPVRIINKNVRLLAKPAAGLKRLIWRGLHIHTGTAEAFREKFDHRARAPFKFNLPGLKAGKA